MTEHQLREAKQCLMILYNRKNGRPEYIYVVQNDNHGYPLFLIRNNNQWVWRSAKHYITRKERFHTYYTEAERERGVFI